MMRVTPTPVLTFCAKTQKIDSQLTGAIVNSEKKNRYHCSFKDILTSKLILTFHFFLRLGPATNQTLNMVDFAHVFDEIKYF